MEKENLETLFESLKNEFDVETPNLGHQERFISKLNSNDSNKTLAKTKGFKFWKPLIAVAATIVLCFSLITVFQQEPEVKDLASVSPELSKTQDFFTSTIALELTKLNNERSPETEALINDALKQLDILEKDYNKLKIDLSESGNDKRVIYAMISNFQNRIEILQNVMQNIEEVKQYNQETI